MEKPARQILADHFHPPISTIKNGKFNSYQFGETVSYPDEKNQMVDWGPHAGADHNCPAGTEVMSITKGVCVYAGSHYGESKSNRSWGGIVVLSHKTEVQGRIVTIYSLYGHLTNLQISVGDILSSHNVIGEIAPALSRENGWWEDSHLHFGILLDPEKKYRGGILPGYVSTKYPYTIQDWIDPVNFLYQPWKAIRRTFTTLAA